MLSVELITVYYYSRCYNKEKRRSTSKVSKSFLMDLGENSPRKTNWGNLPYPAIHKIAKSDLQNIKMYD